MYKKNNTSLINNYHLSFRELLKDMSWPVSNRPATYSLLLALTACGGGGGSSDNNNNDSSIGNTGAITTNTLPVANAGNDQSIDLGAIVTLDASTSSDADGDSLTYHWSISSAPSSSIANLSVDSGVSINFTPDFSGNYVIQLVVNDGTGDSAPDSVTISVNEPPNNTPIADAGDDFSVMVGEQAQLDGSMSLDKDGDTLSFDWTVIESPAGSSAALQNGNSNTPSFVADVTGNYVVSLVVSDGVVDSVPDTVTITAKALQNNNNAPIANAGNDKHTYVNNNLVLNGSNSSDADGNSLSYNWSLDEKPYDSNASLTNASTVSPTLTPDIEGSYVVSLVVNDGIENSVADTVVINVANWLINTSNRSSYIEESGEGVLFDVQTVNETTEDEKEYVSFTATGIPNYTVTITQDIIDKLNSRPKASSDFKGPSRQTTAQVGDVIEFGQDLNYNSDRTCGLGYWPPGPACPQNVNKDSRIPATPKPATKTCEAGVGTIGVLLNGTSVFNWADGLSYNNEKVWNNIAPKFEVHDVDICSGHAENNGQYHHHTFSSCLQKLMGDEGFEHSPIYGFAADGYAIYGPYHDQGVLVKSAWVERDYDDPNSTSGCGVAGKRTCQLVDQYDISKGTFDVTEGPTTSDEVESLSKNLIDASEGVYFEDYYYDGNISAQGIEYLDEHNGHEHGNLGYHYHITVIDDNGTLTPVFPYQVGPVFYGTLPKEGITVCR